MIDAETLPVKELLKILVADASIRRTNLFKVNGGPFHIRFSPHAEEVKRLLKNETWDLVFLSGYMGNWNDPCELEKEVVEAHRAKHVKGVVVFNPIQTEGRNFCKLLHTQGVPVKYIPWDSVAPGVHKEESFL